MSSRTGAMRLTSPYRRARSREKKKTFSANRIELTPHTRAHRRHPSHARARTVMVKAYLRYEQRQVWGVVATGTGDTQGALTYAAGGADGHGKEHLACVALERVNVWDVKRNTKVSQFIPYIEPDEHGVSKPAPRITCVARAPAPSDVFACGASDGSIRLWSPSDSSVDVTLRGHKRDVSALRFSRDGSVLASGGRDSDVVIWDVAGESGVARLRGHRDQVTDCVFLERANVRSGDCIGRALVTTSKDGYVKVWDLDARACTQTRAGFNGETWGVDVNPSMTRVVIGTADEKLHVFDCDRTRDGYDENSPLLAMGMISRVARGRTMTVRFHANGELLGVQGIGRALEIYRVRDEKEAAKKQKRRLKRKREKMEQKAKEAEALGDEDAAKAAREDEVDDGHRAASDEIELAATVTTKHKMRGFAFASEISKKSSDVLCKVAVLLEDNVVQEWEVKEEDEPVKLHTIDGAGHRSDVRAVALAPDDETVLSCSSNGSKLWNVADGSCLRTVAGGYGLCAAFAPGGRHAIVGTKQGAIELIDVNAGEQLAVPDAHEGAVWGLAMLPDDSGFVSASADKTVRFWEWSLEKNEDGLKTLSFNHVRTLQMAEDVLSVQISPDGKLLSVSLLDNTLKVFFADSLKFSLSLYGHRLPALCHDISSDSQLLASAGADKNIRIWGLDFGDCHKSIFAHQDSVMALKFVPKTHYLFSVGKDKLIKYWDADKFDPLLTLEAHHAPVWCLTLSKRGDFLISGSGDRSLRMWERTDEQFFVDEEQERRLESILDEGIEDDGQRPTKDLPEEGEEGIAGRRTLETLTAADAIAEALELADHEIKRLAEHAADNDKAGGKLAPIPPNPLLLGQPPDVYALNAIAKVRPAELEQAILVLPFTFAHRLLDHLHAWLRAGVKIELTCKIAALVLRLHSNQFGRTPATRKSLTDLRPLLRARAKEARDICGFNVAGLTLLENYMRDNQTVDAGDDDDVVAA